MIIQDTIKGAMLDEIMKIHSDSSIPYEIKVDDIFTRLTVYEEVLSGMGLRIQKTVDEVVGGNNGGC